MLDFTIQNTEFSEALTALFANRSKSKADMVDMTAHDENLVFLVTGTEVKASIASETAGTARIPAELLKRLQKTLSTFGDELRVRVRQGEIRVGTTTLRHEAITLRPEARSITGVPADAPAFDLVSLRELYTYEQLNESDLWNRVHQAEKKMQADVERAAALLAEYGISAAETFQLVDKKRTANSAVLRKMLSSPHRP